MENVSQPEFSVIIVAYNHAPYIKQTIDSVLTQSFDNFEIIIIDDGSTDNTKEIVSSFNQPRIKYIYQQNSGLPAEARNRGMSLSRGRYIALLDGDDFWDKEKLKKCKSVLDSMPDIDLVCHNEAIVHQGRVLRYTAYGPYVEPMYERLLFDGNCLHTSAVVIRRKVFFEDEKHFSEDRRLFTIEDYEYWLRLSQSYKFYFLPEVLGNYRVTESGAFLSSGEKNALNMLYLLESHFSRMSTKTKETLRRMKRRRSAVMCAAGRMQHHKNNFRECKKWYKNAIREYPLNYKAIIGYLAALLDLRIIYR
jgi:glycosyltransferase involved in cell wall biosynthesis